MKTRQRQNRIQSATTPENIRKGVVADIGKDGVIRVSDSQCPDVMTSCHILRNTISGLPELQPGNQVLYLVPDTKDEPGCVLGLIEPYRPKVDRVMDKLMRRGRMPSITTIEDEVVRIKAHKGLVIECGKGTIIITEDGKVQIKGQELLSRARGMNRIKGAGINLN